MNEKQKEKMLEMQKDLGLIEINYHPTGNEIIDKLSEKEKADYITIQNAHNILQIKKGVKFFVTLAIINIVADIILAIFMLK